MRLGTHRPDLMSVHRCTFYANTVMCTTTFVHSGFGEYHLACRLIMLTVVHGDNPVVLLALVLPTLTLRYSTARP